MKKFEFDFQGYPAIVLLPDNFNGKWLWKTEFMYAFDHSEKALFERGFARVYLGVSDKYGSDKAIRTMRAFHKYIVPKFAMREKAILVGFSRGGLYAFNYALYYPECVAKVYFDAPVLDLKSWPIKGSEEYAQMLEEYCLTDDTLIRFKGNPLDNLEEYFSHNIPTLVVAGDADELVPLRENAGVLLSYCQEKGILVEKYIKPNCGHHPHCLEDVSPIIAFMEK